MLKKVQMHMNMLLWFVFTCIWSIVKSIFDALHGLPKGLLLSFLLNSGKCGLGNRIMCVSITKGLSFVGLRLSPIALITENSFNMLTILFMAFSVQI